MAKRRQRQGGKPGQFVLDPTENVIALGKAQSERQDQLRKAERRYVESEIARVKEVSELQAAHVREISTIHQVHDYALHKAEAGRTDALRANDREDVKALASATTAKAEALQLQVAASAKALADSWAPQLSDIIKRLSALELTSSEGKGKATVESPIMDAMVSKIEKLTEAVANTGGQKQGATSTRDIIMYFLVAASILFGLWSQFKPH